MEISYSAGGALVLIEFDATTRELHSSSVVATEHPVEKGANISDHVRPELDHLQIEAIVTNSPIRVPRSNLDGATGRVQPLDITQRIRRATTSPLELQVKQKGNLPIGIPGVGAVLRGLGALDSTQVIRVQTLDFEDGKQGQSANVLQFDGKFDRVRSVYDELHTLIESATLVNIATSIREYQDLVLLNMSAPRQTGDGDKIRFTFEARQIRFVSSRRVPVPKNLVGAKKKSVGAKPASQTSTPSSSVAYKLMHP